MTRYLAPFLALLITLPAIARAETVYRWQDATGALLFSNVPERIPAGASPLALAPVAIAVPRVERGVLPEMSAPDAVEGRGLTAERGCGPADPGGLAAAVATRLAAAEELDELTLLIGGVPVSLPATGVVTVAVAADTGRGTALEQGALAFPAGSPCPARPPLERYPVRQSERAAYGDLCDDFRRAFAQVGVTGSRDQSVARSFRAIARDFAAIERAGSVVEADGQRVALPPWTVRAHVAQSASLATETEDLIDELTVALEEIDAAARAADCW